jgi:CheY-like chemotaxis protein
MEQSEKQEETGDNRFRILFLEDERIVVDTVSTMLQHLGYSARFVPDGESAVRACRKAVEAGKPYDLAIMDLSIDDGMGGLEAFREILSFAPDFKAIVSSGYTDDPVMSDFEAYGFKASLPKPFSVGKLEETIQKLISKQQSLFNLI